ncbi:hypothetical protein ACFYRK_11465 [Streptomyces sp. NPDC005381]|uniref:hypothetical protein n=1 Tax=Streptomyces sp. NPDC005381 TaxID=3364714 RepID=UPI0036C53FA6
MTFDIDGFQGLRPPLGQFMLATYGSALAHPNGLLVLFTVRLPAVAWMLLIARTARRRRPNVTATA